MALLLAAWERKIATATAEAAELCEMAVIPAREKCVASPAIISCCCHPLPCPPLLQSHEHPSGFFLLVLFVQVRSLGLGLAVRRCLWPLFSRKEVKQPRNRKTGYVNRAVSSNYVIWSNIFSNHYLSYSLDEYLTLWKDRNSCHLWLI